MFPDFVETLFVGFGAAVMQLRSASLKVSSQRSGTQAIVLQLWFVYLIIL